MMVHLKHTQIENGMFSKKNLRMLIFPLIIEQVLEITVGMVDTMMISYAGEAALSGVSLVDMINTLLINIFAAIATGGAVIVSQYIGRKDKGNACESANQLLMITGIISIVIMAVTIALKKPILQFLFGSIDEAVMLSALTYLFISAFSYPALAIFNSCTAVYRSMGNSRISMFVSAGMNVFNVIGNAVLIFGFDMGVAGAALSTLAARVLAAGVMLVLIQNKELPVFITIRNIFKWDKGLIKKIIYIALPNGVENGLFQLGRVLVVSIIALFGTSQIAANAVANNLDSLGCIAGQAMNLAMITVVGQCVGAGDYDQAVFYAKKLWKTTYIITIACNSVILICLPWILKIYTLSDESYKLAMILVILHDGFAMIFWPTSFTLSNALRAAGDVKYTMAVAVFAMIVFRLVFSLILGVYMGFGAIGVWVAMLFDWLFRAIFYIKRFYGGKWKEIRVID